MRVEELNVCIACSYVKGATALNSDLQQFWWIPSVTQGHVNTYQNAQQYEYIILKNNMKNLVGSEGHTIWSLCAILLAITKILFVAQGFSQEYGKSKQSEQSRKPGWPHKKIFWP